MKHYNPRRIADNLRALDRSDGAKEVSRGSSPEKGNTAPGNFRVPDLPSEVLREEVLWNLSENVDVNSVPTGASKRFLKKILLRAMRLVAGRQAVFNQNAAQALSILIDHAEETNEALAALAAEKAESEARMRRMIHVFREEMRRLQPVASGSGKTGQPEKIIEEMEYLLCEDAWRGSEGEIRRRQEEYVEVLRGPLQTLPENSRTVLDVGCGRGEFVRALRDAGFRAKGVEMNRASAQVGV
ncbi:hypothetical protein HQ520_06070, partial [bacterium]|nr:hypothetical protein [bacterium]